MKSTKIIYWTTTILFAGFMIFTAIPNPEGDAFIMSLGYPKYFIPFISVAKILGSIAILIPAFKKIKEWAYAGLFFDLVAAIYSLLQVKSFDPSMSVMGLVFALGITSYIYNGKMHGASK